MVVFCSDRSTILYANPTDLWQRIYSSADIVHMLQKILMHLTNIVRAPLTYDIFLLFPLCSLFLFIWINIISCIFFFSNLIIWAKFPKTFRCRAWEIYFGTMSSISGARGFVLTEMTYSNKIPIKIIDTKYSLSDYLLVIAGSWAHNYCDYSNYVAYSLHGWTTFV